MGRTSIFLLLFFVLGLGTACQTYSLKTFDRVANGMEKHDVLELLGDPQRKRRIQGTDKWVYIFYDKAMRTEREIHFVEGNVTYRGEPVKPTVSAEEQDRIQAASNLELEKQHEQRRQEIQANRFTGAAEVSSDSDDEDESTSEEKGAK